MVSDEMYLAVHVCMHLCTSPYPCDPTHAIRIFMTVVVVSQVQSLKRELSAKARKYLDKIPDENQYMQCAGGMHGQV